MRRVISTSQRRINGSLGRSTVRAQPATRTGWWIPVTAFVGWLVYRQVDAVTAVEVALVCAAVFIAIFGFSVARAAAHRWWGGTSRTTRTTGDRR